LSDALLDLRGEVGGLLGTCQRRCERRESAMRVGEARGVGRDPRGDRERATDRKATGVELGRADRDDPQPQFVGAYAVALTAPDTYLQQS
jgi:hypothetical protein